MDSRAEDRPGYVTVFASTSTIAGPRMTSQRSGKVDHRVAFVGGQRTGVVVDVDDGHGSVEAPGAVSR